MTMNLEKNNMIYFSWERWHYNLFPACSDVIYNWHEKMCLLLWKLKFVYFLFILFTLKHCGKFEFKLNKIFSGQALPAKMIFGIPHLWPQWSLWMKLILYPFLKPLWQINLQKLFWPQYPILKLAWFILIVNRTSLIQAAWMNLYMNLYPELILYLVKITSFPSF